MKLSSKLLLGAVAAAFVCFACLFANSFFGNPLSKELAQRGATAYLAATYPNLTYLADEATYSFKFGGYHMQVRSSDSIDTFFTLEMDMRGKVRYDSYESSVTNRWNTLGRIEEEYRGMVDAVLSAPDFPFSSEIDFGTIVEAEKPILPGYPQYGVERKDLVLDQEYDVKALAKTAGKIIYYAADEDVSFDKAAEMLLLMKEYFDRADVAFYTIDFVLEKPHNPDGTPNQDQTAIRMMDFPAAELYPDGLAQRIKDNHDLVTAYYAEQDAEKDQAVRLADQ